ncbi:MAG: response regulator [Desulfobacteraceae bacterium]|nr:response regulator [Desulfobacteraceae bacterium]
MPYKVLSVDDSQTIRQIVKKAFEPYDCEIMEAQNGKEGLAMAESEKPDLIILDITMPVMTGIEMLAKLKDDPNLMQIPVIMLTAESGKEYVMQLVKMGVSDYMAKPFKGEQLIDRVKNFLDLDGLGKDSSDIIGSFKPSGQILIYSFPVEINRKTVKPILAAVREKCPELPGAGIKHIILDITKIPTIDMRTINLIVTILKTLREKKIHSRIVGTKNQSEAFKGFQETSNIPIQVSLEKAKADF